MYIFQTNMTVAIIASKSAIIISIMMIVVALRPNDLSDKSSKFLESNEDKDGPETSFCSLKSWFQKISDPSFECNQQEFDATGGINIFLSI